MADELNDYTFQPQPTVFWMGLGGLPMDHSMIRVPDSNIETPLAAAEKWQQLSSSSVQKEDKAAAAEERDIQQKNGKL